MKALYLLLAAGSLCLIVLLNVMSFATTPAESTMARLARVPDAWKMDVLENSPRFSKGDEETLKKHVLQFYAQAGSPTFSKIGHFETCLLITLGFSLLGYGSEWMHQRHRLKK